MPQVMPRYAKALQEPPRGPGDFRVSTAQDLPIPMPITAMVVLMRGMGVLFAAFLSVARNALP
jgi:hypothetical protein